MLPWVMALLLQHLKGSWVTWPSPVEGLLRAMAMATASVLLQARVTGRAPAIRPIHKVLPKATRRVPRLSRPRLRVTAIGGAGIHSTIPVLLNNSSHRIRPRSKDGSAVYGNSIGMACSRSGASGLAREDAGARTPAASSYSDICRTWSVTARPESGVKLHAGTSAPLLRLSSGLSRPEP